MKYVKKKADQELQYIQSPEKEDKYWSEEAAKRPEIKEEIVNTKELINEIKQMRKHQQMQLQMQ